MAENQFSWLKAIWKGLQPVLITAGVTVALNTLDLFQAQMDAGGVKLGFLTGVVIGLVNFVRNILKNYNK